MGLAFVLWCSLACNYKYSSINSNERFDKPLKIAVISDLNSSYGSVTYNAAVSAVINELAVIKPDIINKFFIIIY